MKCKYCGEVDSLFLNYFDDKIQFSCCICKRELRPSDLIDEEEVVEEYEKEDLS